MLKVNGKVRGYGKRGRELGKMSVIEIHSRLIEEFRIYLILFMSLIFDLIYFTWVQILVNNTLGCG